MCAPQRFHVLFVSISEGKMQLNQPRRKSVPARTGRRTSTYRAAKVLERLHDSSPPTPPGHSRARAQLGPGKHIASEHPLLKELLRLRSELMSEANRLMERWRPYIGNRPLHYS